MRLPISHTRLAEVQRGKAGALGAQRSGRSIDAAGGDALELADLPAVVLDRLDAIARLRDVPFGYLVPDPDLIPPEALRVFAVDEHWIRAAQAGLLSVAEQSTSDTLTQLPVPGLARTGPLTGFVLRTRLIVDHPGLQVVAHDAAGAQLEPVRIERLAAGMLLVVVAGVLTTIAITEPHHGLRLGITSTTTDLVLLRRGDGRATAGPAAVPVPWRNAAPDGVLDVAELARRIDAAGAPGVPAPTGPAALALHLIQAPIRQRFSSEVP